MSKAAIQERADDRPEPASLYERDYHGWIAGQVALLRSGAGAGLDAPNLADELDGLARSEVAKLQSAMRVLLMHILKWEHQPERRSRSRANTIAIQRQHYADGLDDNPSLKRREGDILARAYRLARLDASSETDLPVETFPDGCPYTRADILLRPFTYDPHP